MTLLDRDAAVTRAEPGSAAPTRSVRPAPVARPAIDEGRPDERWPLVGAAALLAAFPLVTDPAGWHVFLAARWLVVVLGATVLVGGLAITRRLRLPRTWPWWLAMVGVAAVSAAVSSAPGVSWWGAADRFGGGATWVVHGAAAVIGASVVRRSHDLRVLARGVSVGAIVVTAVVSAQRLGWDVVVGGSVTRPGGPLGNADFLGAYASLALLVALGAALDHAADDRWRLAHTVAALGAGTCLIVSGTRAGWVGVAVGLVVLGVLIARRSGTTGRQAMVVVALAVLGLIGLGMWAGVGHRLATVFDGTAAGRVATWERTASVVGERPVLGWGPEGFAEGFGRSVDESWERSYGRRLTPDRAHNGLLDVAVSTGLLGLAVYVGLLARAGGLVRRSLRGTASATSVGVAAALIAYLVQQQFLFQLFDVDAIAWLLAGGVGALGTVESTGSPGGHDRPRWSGAPLVGALLVLTVVAGSDVIADRDARRAVDAATPGAAVDAATDALERRPQTMHALLLADAALADGSSDRLAVARERLGEARSATFDDGRLTLARSRLARADGHIAAIEESEREVVELLSVDPARGDAWLELGAVQVALSAGVDAQSSLERAVVLAPHREDAWTLLGVTATRNGDIVTAAGAFGRVDPAALDAEELAAWREVQREVRRGGLASSPPTAGR